MNTDRSDIPLNVIISILHGVEIQICHGVKVPILSYLSLVLQ